MTAFLGFSGLSVLMGWVPIQHEIHPIPLQNIIKSTEKTKDEKGNPAVKTSYKTEEGCLVQTVLDVSSPRYDYVVTSYYEDCASFASVEERVDYPVKITQNLFANPRPYVTLTMKTIFLYDTRGNILQKKRLVDKIENMAAHDFLYKNSHFFPDEQRALYFRSDGKWDDLSIWFYAQDSDNPCKTLSGKVNNNTVVFGKIDTYDCKNEKDPKKVVNYDYIEEGFLKPDKRSDNPVEQYTIYSWLTR